MMLLTQFLVCQAFAIPIAFCIVVVKNLLAQKVYSDSEKPIIKVGPINDQEVYYIASRNDEDIKEIISKMKE